MDRAVVAYWSPAPRRCPVQPHVQQVNSMSTVGRVHCALYQLGYNTQLLLAVVEDYWFAAGPDTQFPHSRANLLGEIQTQAIVAAESLELQALAETIQQIALASETAWSWFRENWHGSHHLEVIQTLESMGQVSDFNGNEWWEQSTPLAQTPFHELTLSLTSLTRELPPNLACCFTTGRLVAQVLTLPYGRCEQDEIRGERFPVGALRQQLSELRRRVDTLTDLEVYLPEDFAPIAGVSHAEYCKWVVHAAHSLIVSRLSTTSECEPSDDGRCDSTLHDITPMQAFDVAEQGELPNGGSSGVASPTGCQSPEGAARPGLTGAIRQPTPNALAVYRASLIMAWDTQEELARQIREHLGIPATQGQVSRWLRAVTDFLEAGNVLPDLRPPSAGRERAMDPSIIDQGPRLDPRDPRPSDINGDD